MPPKQLTDPRKIKERKRSAERRELNRAMSPSKGWTLQIGQNKYPVRNLAHASWLYSKLRDESGEGYHTWLNGYVHGDPKVTYWISYNGNVWKGDQIPVLPAVWGPESDARFEREDR
jgi:hypothetical protein